MTTIYLINKTREQVNSLRSTIDNDVYLMFNGTCNKARRKAKKELSLHIELYLTYKFFLSDLESLINL